MPPLASWAFLLAALATFGLPVYLLCRAAERITAARCTSRCCT